MRDAREYSVKDAYKTAIKGSGIRSICFSRSWHAVSSNEHVPLLARDGCALAYSSTPSRLRSTFTRFFYIHELNPVS